MKMEKYKGSIKIMNSYDYSHFEVCLSSEKVVTIAEINSIRKVGQRLVDESIRQYKIAKKKEAQRVNLKYEKDALIIEVSRIKAKPKSEWTAEDKAKIKALADHVYWSQHDYDYEDDWEDDEG